MDDELRDRINEIGLDEAAKNRLVAAIEAALQRQWKLAGQHARMLESILATAMNRSHIEPVAAILDVFNIPHGLGRVLETLDHPPAS